MKYNHLKHNRLFFALLCILLCFSNVHMVQAADHKFIRVGLKSLYDGVETITIYNKEIAVGYCIDSGYQVDETLKSSKGFTFESFRSYYIELQEEFRYFSTAKNTAVTISALGVDAYPVKAKRGGWKIYVDGGKSEASSKDIYETINNRFGFTYHSAKIDSKHLLKVQADSYAFLIDGRASNSYPQFQAVDATNAKENTIDLGKRRYRGRIEIGRYGVSSLTAVNVVNLEHYLYGVVPSEMISTWPLEALKAQAVSARGYAMKIAGFSSGSNINNAYTLGDTAKHQVYKGYVAETSRSNQAVNETAGETLQYQGEIITPYYSSTSGGSTEAIEDVWSSSRPYLKSVSDIYETNPSKKPWLIEYSSSELQSLLGKQDFQIDSIKNIVSEIKTDSGRTISLRIQGEKQFVTLQKSTIRSILSMPSSKFKVVKYGDTPDKVSVKSASRTNTTQIQQAYILSADGEAKKADASMEQYIVKSADNLTNYPINAPKDKHTYLFAGMGYGHGVGMSQSGARGMADAGFTYQEILTHYYTGTQVVK